MRFTACYRRNAPIVSDPFAGRRRAGLVIAAGLSLLASAVCAPLFAGSGKSGYGYGRSSKSYYQNMMRDTARQQADMERDQREQQRAAEQAQRDAQKEASRLQAVFEAEQRRQQAQQMRDADRQRQQTQREMEATQRQAQRDAEQARAQALRDMNAARQRSLPDGGRQAQQGGSSERSSQQQWQRSQQTASSPQQARNTPRKDDDADDSSDDGDEVADMDPDLKRAFDDDENNPNLSSAERRMREIERVRQMEERRHARALLALKRKNEQRFRSNPEGADNGEGKPSRSDDTPARQNNPPRGDVADTQDDTKDGSSSGDDQMLSGWQRQAMRLGGSPRDDSGKGRGPLARRDDDSDDAGSRRSADRESANSDQDKDKTSADDPKRDASKRGDPKRDASKDGDRRRKVAQAAPPPPGAEFPLEQFEEQREQELVVPQLSAEDLKTAEAQGFEASPPTEVGKSGTKVQRLRLRGSNRAEAERELHRLLPFASATPNYAYKIFLGSEGQPDALKTPGQKAGPASSQPCPASVCFGSQLIKWTPRHTSCVRDVRVGVIDTSFDTAHPAFRHLKSIGQEFLDGREPSPYDWHGTAVLSLLAGDPGSGTPGLVPDATFLLASAFRSDVNGNASTDTVRLLAALAWLEDLHVDVVNMSFSGPEDPSLARAIERMSKKGIVFIAAAGNMGPTAGPSYPAAYKSVIAVTAVNRDGINYKNANRGTYIDFSAPGVDVLAALPHAQQGLRTGTSFAAPFVTAIVAAGGTQLAQGVSTAKFVTRLPVSDLGPPGQDPTYGAGLALAPQRCGVTGHGEVAQADAETAPHNSAWSTETTTTFIHAGASAAP